MSPNEQSSYHPALHRYTLVTAGWTFILLLAGALVTSTGSSLAVPDWPLAFGKFFPNMTGGVFFEHGHRMVAGVAACMTLGLGIALLVKEEGRKGVKIFVGAGFTAMILAEAGLWAFGHFATLEGGELLVASALLLFFVPLFLALVTSSMRIHKLTGWAWGAVLLQAVLGGATVLLHLPTWVSVCHAGLAQIFFCLIVSLALVTSKGWIEAVPNRLTDRPSTIRFWAFLTTMMTYLQILIGAVTRHSGSGLAIPDFPLSFGQLLPPEWSPSVALQFSHTRIGAFIVLYMVTHTAYRVCTHYPEEKALFWPAAAAGLFVWLQCFLGLIVIATSKDVVPTSLHVIVGAATLAAMLVLTLNSFHLFKKGPVS